MAVADFSGFPADTIPFLTELRENNEREWFQERKERYEASVREPALAFITAMQGPLKKVSRHLEATPKKVGGSLMRIYRDTRFGADKTPYKTNIGIQFRHEAGFDVHCPGCYLHIEPGEVFLGAGIWRPDRDSLLAIREYIDAEPAAWKRVRNNKKFNERFQLSGDSLKRPPAGFDKEHPLIDDLKRKDFIAITSVKSEAIQSPHFVSEVTEAFKAAGPLMRFLCNALELPY
ncbi:DUF2461 domain-containing protein [Rubinisphaera brasiliensis]|uniref:TIGR02453 family protein n=1 Tax=Rubinisphaera brasiliensis (strain ATCC 49424 / DSM 5305 / JCM 21570 / IAM 15109 / NBRC 103401 / IFAM 1448) TaxID=756272 RepID=F0SRH6_RUBBR|nr:DUF2461 domain-containing protein [Rubinisphaera brasiliensis]ADY58037.1 Conserved hypothetical protein CHP02453 [Rubinisphaera brasiliensis DSM 5305]